MKNAYYICSVTNGRKHLDSVQLQNAKFTFTNRVTVSVNHIQYDKIIKLIENTHKCI